jgi:hypothetical protein
MDSLHRLSAKEEKLLKAVDFGALDFVTSLENGGWYPTGFATSMPKSLNPHRSKFTIDSTFQVIGSFAAELHGCFVESCRVF